MVDTLPALAPSMSRPKDGKEGKAKEDDQSQAISAMCKTLNATVTKLLYSFAALNSEAEAGAGSAASSLKLALAASKRDELSIKIADALANSVERVIKCKDASLRSLTLREVRARFSVQEKPKVEMCDQGVQAAPRKPKVSLAAAANAVMNHKSPTAVAFMGSFKKDAEDEKAKTDAEEAKPSNEEVLKKLAVNTEAPATATDGAPALTAHEIRLASAKAAKEAKEGKKPRPASATDSEGGAKSESAKLPGIYERQVQWAKRAAEKREQMKVEKENREREAEKPAEGGRRSKTWAHVESVMKRERVAAEEGWRSDMYAEMAEERELRRESERKAREQAERASLLQADRDRAEEARRDAIKKVDAVEAKMAVTQAKYEKAKEAQDTLASQYKEELEIRDAFGDKGLEAWPMFPGRKLFRVLESDNFDGRVSQEFRVKDEGSGERGVTLLMGRLAHTNKSEAQAVLFDEKYFTPIQAARWWQQNGARFEQVKERTEREKQRAQSAQPGSRRAEPRRNFSLNDEMLEKFPGLK